MGMVRGDLNGVAVAFDGERVTCREPVLRVTLERVTRAALERGESVPLAWARAFGAALALEREGMIASAGVTARDAAGVRSSP